MSVIRLPQGRYVIKGRPALVIEKDLAIEDDAPLVVIIGKNGSGKSTLCQILAGVLEPEAGNGNEQTYVPASPPPVLVWQQRALFPVSVERNISVVPGEADVGQLLIDFYLGPKAKHHAHRISGGEQSRLAIARAVRALSGDRQAIIFDEPTASVDPSLVDDIAAIIAGDGARGRLAGVVRVVVTHDARLVSLLAPRKPRIHILEPTRLREGQIVESRLSQSFPVDELYSAPPTLYAAEFVGYENVFQLLYPDRERKLGHLESLPQAGSGPDPNVFIPEGPFIVIPPEACYLSSEVPTSDDWATVDVVAYEFRDNGRQVLRCRWRADSGGDLQFVVSKPPQAMAIDQRLYLTVNWAFCKAISENADHRCSG